MRILALETDIEGIKQRFLSVNEREILTVFRHGFFFFLSIVYQIFLTIALIAAGIGLRAINLPWEISPGWIATAIVIAWVFLAFPAVLKAFLDWRFDFLFITTDKIVVADQLSLFHHRITPMNIENIASVTGESQFWNLFPFGAVHFHLKEGTGESFRMTYIPHADEVAAKIADTVTQFHQRRLLPPSPYPISPPPPPPPPALPPSGGPSPPTPFSL